MQSQSSKLQQAEFKQKAYFQTKHIFGFNIPAPLSAPRELQQALKSTFVETFQKFTVNERQKSKLS